MKELVIADRSNIEDLVALRVEMQIEDWNRTLNRDFSPYAEEFSALTRKHITQRLNQSLYFSMLYLDGRPVAICGLEELSELPQITICTDPAGRHGCIVSVYTKPDCRGKGYQQEALKHLLAFAHSEHFNDITLTTNSPDAAHIYEKLGFARISEKYFLGR